MNAPIPTHLFPQVGSRPVPPAMLAALRAHFGDRCSTAQAVREQHGRDTLFDVGQFGRQAINGDHFHFRGIEVGQ